MICTQVGIPVYIKKVPESRFFPDFLYSKKIEYFIVFIM